MRSAADLVTKTPVVRFRRQPAPVPAELRPLWRVSQLLILLAICGHGKQKRISVRRLHVVAWGTRSPQTQAQVISQFSSADILGGAFVGVDPALNMAIDFAAGEGMITYMANGRISLTPLGISAAQELLRSECLAFERTAAYAIKPHVTETSVNRVFARVGT